MGKEGGILYPLPGGIKGKSGRNTLVSVALENKNIYKINHSKLVIIR